MKKLPTLFISYNTGSDFEETLAMRLHTIGAIHGFQMLLPDRTTNSSSLSLETQNRISVSDYFLLFSTRNLSQTVQKEIEFAFQRINDKSKILIIYDKQKGKNLVNTDHCTELFIDSHKNSIPEILNQIIKELNNTLSNNQIKNNQTQPSNGNVLAGILLAGLGLLVLGALLTEEKK